MIKVVLDAMGGDLAPQSNLAGARLAVERGIARPEQIVLAGPRALIAAQWAALGTAGTSGGPSSEGADPGELPFVVEDAPDVLTCDESPVDGLRRKPQNSISVGIQAVAEQRAAAFISAGSTGAVAAVAGLSLPRLEGIRRPGIAVTINGEGGAPFVVLDVGANPQPKAIDLLHYGIMGSAYAKGVLRIEKPRVGVLSIGSEETKGNPLTREAAQLLRQSPVHFIGNVEGTDLFSARCDVVVCDGFTGNVLLKVSEGVAEYFMRTTYAFMKEAALDPAGMKTVLGRLHQRVDYAEYGGAQLLGVDGIVTICHGRSDAPAICNAIRFALRSADARVNEHIVAAARASAAPS